MKRWRSFECNKNKYDLSHLYPMQVTYIQPAIDGKAERRYLADVCFSLHCFTKALDAALPEFNYSSSQETRTFDISRYELSKQLPQIVRSLDKLKCLHTGKNNFFVIEVIDAAGKKADYEVYFDVYPSKTAGKLHIFVQSAYIRDKKHGNRPRNKKINFFIILHNRLAGKVIKAPQ